MSINDEQQFTVAVFGADVSGLTLLDTVRDLAYTYHLSMRNSPHTLSHVKDLHSKHLTTKTLEELLTDSALDVILLCLSPYMQYKTLTGVVDKLSSRKFTRDSACDTDSRLPHLVLVPPVAPVYATDDLVTLTNDVGIAMPLRLLPGLALLHDHLRSLREPGSGLRSGATSLPVHWSLGDLRYVHIRLASVNPVQPGCDYSWLCEPGGMGGGLLNRFGAELIDLVHRVSGGLPATVTCIGRVFDRGAAGRLQSEHRQMRSSSAEDYLLVTGELRMPAKGDGLAADEPVFMLCLSADLPCSAQTDALMKNEEFSLSLEIAGSTGTFIVPESGDEIQWSPRGRINKANTVQQMNSDEIINGHPYKDQLNGPVGQQANGYLNSHHQSNSPGWMSRSISLENPITYPIRVSKKNSIVEVAHLFTNSSSGVQRKYPIDALRTPPAIQDAWFTWCRSLPSALNSANGSAELDQLLASPAHWICLQRVVTAIAKAARLRCCVEVDTHSPLS